MLNTFFVSKSKLLCNLDIIKNKLKRQKICAMVKAKAYGIGTKHVVEILDKKVDFFGVANQSEAKEIKRISKTPVLIVGPLEKQFCKDFSYTCSCIEDIKRIKRTNKPIKIHLKINSGMNRYGFSDIKEFERALKEIQNSNLIFEGMFTHFCTHDKFVNKQFRFFKQFVLLAKKCKFDPIIHCDSSFSAIHTNHKMDMSRLGFNLFDCSEFGFCEVCEIYSTVVQINKVKQNQHIGYNKQNGENEKRIAVVPVGYADGFDMHLVGFNLDVGGINCKVENICMDCFLLDITNTEIKKGDIIQILGNRNSLKKYANYLMTHEYEVMCKLSHIRAKRKIVD